MKNCKLVIKDEVNIQFNGLDPVTRRKLVDAVKYFLPYARHLPQYKLGRWDGTISFCDVAGRSYLNLLDRLLPIVYDAHYDVEIEDLRNPVEINFPTIKNDSYSHVKWPAGHPAEGQGILLKDHQVELVNSFLNNIQGINICPTSGGKAQPLSSLVLTPGGWTKMGDLSVGDSVIAANGNETKISGIYPQGEKWIYRVQFSDGRSVECTHDHLWNIKSKAYSNWETLPLKQIIKIFDKDKTVRIPLRIPNSVPDISVESDPYAIGLITANGLIDNSGILIELYDRDVSYFNSFMPNVNLELITSNSQEADGEIVNSGLYRLTDINENGIIDLLITSKLETPKLLSQSGTAHKTEYLRGLTVLDRSPDPRSYRVFKSSNLALLNSVKNIVWELGGKCQQSSSSQLKIYFDRENPVALYLGLDNQVELEIVNIERLRTDLAQCISIEDNSHLYVTDHYVVTHNTICTAILSHQAEKYGRTILIVPNKDLVIQTTTDYANLGLEVGQYFGDRHDTDKKHTICTWQSLEVLYKNQKTQNGKLEIDKFLDGVVAVIVDETHRAKGEVLRKLLSGPFANVPIRWGLTGTMPEDEHETVSVISCLGPVHNKIKVRDLQEKGIVADLDIHVTQLVDSDHSSPFPNYAAEQKWLSTNKDRLSFLAEFINEKASDSGNTLVLVDRIETGKTLEKLIPNSIFLSGSTKSVDRKKEYDSINGEENKVLIATAAIASTGISINRIFNLILIEPGKSFVKVIQSIGRGLRVAKDKSRVDVYDICSDAKYSKSHLAKRKKFYKEAEYKFNVSKIKY